MTDQIPTDKDAQEALGIANALIKARNELGMTQAQLAEVSGISRSAIKGYETGRNMPGSRELKALCKALKLSPNVLLFGTETPFSDPNLEGAESEGFRLFLTDPEDAKRARARLAGLVLLLTNDEMASLLNLINALAIARHGAEVVEKHIAGADLIASMFGKSQVHPTEMNAEIEALLGESKKRN
ncbi:MAG: XRE family transcriptional regulator [Rubrivivax sp.]|nr:MAG: XRE family transcriptional regulator [Rubrivivax sp.]